MNWSLKKRGSTYSIRVLIPSELRHLHQTASGKPKTEHVETLGTSDRKAANAKAVAKLPGLIKKIYKLPDPADYHVDPRIERISTAKGPVEAISDTHPELIHVAERIEETHGEQVAKRWVQQAGRITLMTAPARYRKFVEKRGKNTEKTRSTQEKHQLEFAKWFQGGDAKLRDVSRLDASAYCDYLLEQGMAPKTFNLRLSSLSALWTWAEQQELVDRNIWAKRNLPSTTVKEPRAYTPEEIQALGEKLPDPNKPYHFDLFLLLLFTGCRIEEVCSLTVDQVTRDDKANAVNGFEARDGKAGQGSKHFIPVIDAEAVAILTNRIAGKGPDERVFDELTRGAQGWSHNVAKTLRRAVRKALGFPVTGTCEVDNHSFRRTHATAAENSGLAFGVIDRLQRRKTGSIGGDVYSAGLHADKMTAVQQQVTNEIRSRYFGQP